MYEIFITLQNLVQKRVFCIKMPKFYRKMKNISRNMRLYGENMLILKICNSSLP